MILEFGTLTNFYESLCILCNLVPLIVRIALLCVHDFITTPWNFVSDDDEQNTPSPQTTRAPTIREIIAKVPVEEKPIFTAITTLSEENIEETPDDLRSDKETTNDTALQMDNQATTDQTMIPQESNDGALPDDPFWNMNTLPTALHREISAGEHVPKYNPDYDTLAELNKNVIFPEKQ